MVSSSSGPPRPACTVDSHRQLVKEMNAGTSLPSTESESLEVRSRLPKYRKFPGYFKLQSSLRTTGIKESELPRLNLSSALAHFPCLILLICKISKVELTAMPTAKGCFETNLCKALRTVITYDCNSCLSSLAEWVEGM